MLLRSIDFNTTNCECFICLQETYIDNKSLPIRLIHQPLYIKSCSCDGWIHYSCLQNWYNANDSCPICRIRVRPKRENYEGEEDIDSCCTFVCCFTLLSMVALMMFYYY